MDYENVATHFSVDEDDDGFIDYAQLERSEVQNRLFVVFIIDYSDTFYHRSLHVCDYYED